MINDTKAQKLIGYALVFLITFFLIFVANTISVNAVENTGTDSRVKLEQELKEKKDKPEQEKKARLEQRQTKVTERKQEVKAKLEDKRLEACTKRETSINRHMQRIADRAAKQLEAFNKISERVQGFYTEKSLTLSNYALLVEDSSAKKAAAEAAIADLKNSSVDFKCDSEDPVGTAEAFKGARQEVVVAMKEYKTSVKNLIVAVKSVASKKTEGEQ